MLDPKNPDHIKSIEKCRNIKQEIINFGINELEIVKLIELLSLELENSDLMRSINTLIKNDKNHNNNKVNLQT